MTPTSRPHCGEVQATLREMLAAADQQHAAVVARDRERIENVARQQERLAARLARAEAWRRETLGESSLLEAASTHPAVDELRSAIAASVHELKERQAHSARLLTRTIDLTRQTLDFIQRIVTVEPPAYRSRGVGTSQQSLLVDSRA